MPARPAADVALDADLVTALLADQHPDLAGRPVRLVAQGWDNATFRLGDDLAVRLPRREAAARLVEHEQQWLPSIAARCPVPVPVPVRAGRPSALFGWSWSVVPWIPGVTASGEPVASRTAWAGDLADALTAVHEPADVDAPVNPVRGGPLAGRADALRGRLEAGHLDAVLRAAFPDAAATGSALRAPVTDLWERAVSAPPWPGPALWLHGDPHPANVLVRRGRLAALLDFGDVTGGDPAADLATAWLTFDARGREEFRDRTDTGLAETGLPRDDALWTRAAGWALVVASAMCAHSDDDPVIAAIGRHAMLELMTGVDAPLGSAVP